MSYTIDGSAVNARPDWRHQRRPTAPQGRREEQFPGIPQRFGVLGLSMPPDIMVQGFLQAEGASLTTVYAELHGDFDTYEAMLGDGATHRVSVQGVDFDDCQLVALNSLGFSQPAGVGGVNKRVRLGVRFLWRQLARGVGGAA